VKGAGFLGLPLVEFAEVSRFHPPSACKMFIAIGYSRMNQVRAAKYFAAKEMGYELVSYVSSDCTYLSEMPAGDNCFILEGNTIQPFVRIGNNVTIWSGGHIGHDSVIEDHCFCAPRVAVSGRVHIGSYCFIGLNATIRNGVHVSSRSLVGAGALVMKDTEEDSVYVAGPTDVSKKKSSEIKL
jgi:sugar O-acyltransferase (sialic acid O-acetyltransferase NeuD family)